MGAVGLLATDPSSHDIADFLTSINFDRCGCLLSGEVDIAVVCIETALLAVLPHEVIAIVCTAVGVLGYPSVSTLQKVSVIQFIPIP